MRGDITAEKRDCRDVNRSGDAARLRRGTICRVKYSRQWLFNGVAAASFLLCLATSAIWIRSYWRYDLIRWSGDTPNQADHILLRWSLGSLRGGFAVDIIHNDASDDAAIRNLQDYSKWHPRGFEVSSDRVSDLDAVTKSSWRASYLFKPTSPTFLGAQAGSAHGLYGGNRFWWIELSIPYWMPACIFMILPIWWAFAWWKHRRRIKCNVCPACGYDLRSSPQRCPECGTIATK
jgi:hypothetical protein